jgi:DNA-binding NarL/FixJ family response regulator
MEDRLCIAVVDDHARLVSALRASVRLRVLGPFAAHDRSLPAGPADVIVVDLDRDDDGGLATLVNVCGALDHVRVVAATAERDPELGTAIVTAGASGLVASDSPVEDIEDALRRAAAGELVLPDEHLTSLVARLRVVRRERVEAASVRSLTARELEVLHSLSLGQSTREIAVLLGISPMTVQSHVKNVLTKLGVHSKVEAVRLAWRSGAIAMPATA